MRTGQQGAQECGGLQPGSYLDVGCGVLITSSVGATVLLFVPLAPIVLC
jgi:hypothetical protein